MRQGERVRSSLAVQVRPLQSPLGMNHRACRRVSVSALLASLAASAAAHADVSPRARVTRHERRPLTSHLVDNAVTGAVQYYGGHVISRVQIVAVMWGSSVAAEAVQGVGPFYAALVNSAYFDWMGEYDTAGLKGAADALPGSGQHIYRGTFLKTLTINPAVTSGTIQDSAIQTELAAQIQSGALPPPKIDAEGGVDTLYMLHFPPGVSIQDASGALSCSSFCAYHSTVSLPNVAAGVPYGVMPDFSTGACAQGCGGASGSGSVMDSYSATGSHEIGEAVTDAEIGIASGAASSRPLAWYDTTNGEIGDICENDPASFVQLAGYLVQKQWSQRTGTCIAEDPSLGVCNGMTRPCRACTAADDGHACAGATPFCDATDASPSAGQCVACRANTECTSPGKAICDATSRTCRGCTADADCAGGPPKCDVPSGSCVTCLTDADCGSGMACDTTSRACVARPSTGGVGDGGGLTAGGSDGGGGGGVVNGASPSGDPGSGGGASSGGCSTSPAGTASGWFFGLLGLVGLARGRRARRGA